MRPTLYGNRHAVSSGHYLASAAAFTILENGGNAVDAGCCAGMALAVLHPDEVNFAGVAPIMIRTAAGRLVTIAGLGHWPAGIPADYFLTHHGGEIPHGVVRTVVPAAPDAWITALRDFGTMSFGEVAGAAVEFARDGFSVFPFMASELERRKPESCQWPANTEIFHKDGGSPRVGDRFVQSDLAASIQYMIDEERARAGDGREAGLEAARAAFYVGDIAQRIVAFHEAEGGFLTREDLATFRSRYEPAVTRRWRGFEINTCGPWCQGPMLIEALLLLEAAGLDGLSHNSPEYLHLFVECMKCALADREQHYGDPAFVAVDLDRLFSPDHLKAWVDGIDPTRSATDTIPPLHAARHGSGVPVRDPDTSYLCVVDRWGNTFSATPSDEASRSPIIPGLGFCPSSRGSQSRPDPRHPSGVAPGKRPRLTPNPAIAVRDDGATVPFGGPGGDSQVQSMLQVFLNAFHFGMDIQEAIDAPRVRSFNAPSSFAPFEVFPNLVMAESRLPEAAQEGLRRRGHRLELYPGYSREVAGIEMILAEPKGFLRAGADPRQPAYAIVR